VRPLLLLLVEIIEMSLGLHNYGCGAKDRCFDRLGFYGYPPGHEMSGRLGWYLLPEGSVGVRSHGSWEHMNLPWDGPFLENTVRRSIDTPFNIDAALDVSSSTVLVGSSSIFTFPAYELFVVPDRLDALDIDRSDLTGTSWVLSISSYRRFRGLGSSFSTAVSVFTISSTTWIDSAAVFLAFNADSRPK